MNVDAVAAALRTALEAIDPKPKVFDYGPGAGLAPPYLIVPLFPQVTYDYTKGAAPLVMVEWPVHVLVGLSDMRVARVNLAPWLASDGGVKAALEADVTLDGLVDTLRVTKAEVGTMAVAGRDLFGATFTVEIVGR